jgi:hypothetical protein
MMSEGRNAQNGTLAVPARKAETRTPRLRAHMIAGRYTAPQTFGGLWLICLGQLLSPMARRFAPKKWRSYGRGGQTPTLLPEAYILARYSGV